MMALCCVLLISNVIPFFNSLFSVFSKCFFVEMIGRAKHASCLVNELSRVFLFSMSSSSFFESSAELFWCFKGVFSLVIKKIAFLKGGFCKGGK